MSDSSTSYPKAETVNNQADQSKTEQETKTQKEDVKTTTSSSSSSSSSSGDVYETIDEETKMELLKKSKRYNDDREKTAVLFLF